MDPEVSTASIMYGIDGAGHWLASGDVQAAGSACAALTPTTVATKNAKTETAADGLVVKLLRDKDFVIVYRAHWAGA